MRANFRRGRGSRGPEIAALVLLEGERVFVLEAQKGIKTRLTFELLKTREGQHIARVVMPSISGELSVLITKGPWGGMERDYVQRNNRSTAILGKALHDRVGRIQQKEFSTRPT